MKYESDANRDARIQRERCEMDELRAELHDEDIEKGMTWPKTR